MIKPCPFCGDVSPVQDLGWIRCQNISCITYSIRAYTFLMWNSKSFRRGVSEGLFLARLNLNERQGKNIPELGNIIHG